MLVSINNTHHRLTNSEIRELILMKDHKLQWDKRGMYDVIVIFDSDSQYNSVAELSNSPINIVRECTTDCLDPNFINSDLPKVSVVICLFWHGNICDHSNN